MAQINGGQISVRQGSFDGTTTSQNDLIRQGAVRPEVREILEIKNKRFFMTLLTSGAVGKWGIDYNKRTKIPQVDAKKLIGNIAYKFDVQSSIEQAATIVNQVGASNTDGTFQLNMADNYLFKNQAVRFKSGRQALVTGNSGTVYSFKMITGATFSYSSDVGSYLTCFPMYTAYPEGSLRSDSRSKSPDSFVNYMTIQRKTVKTTGSAESDVLWYSWADTNQKIGWLPIKVAQGNTQFNVEGERQVIWGVSSMKASDGSLLTESALGNDAETGYPTITGDGFEEQIPSSNVLTASGVTGNAVLQDFTDLMTTMQKSSNMVDGLEWVCITGTEGMANAQVVLAGLAANQNTTYFQNVNQTGAVGGAEVHAGLNFCNLNVAGNTTSFFVHPLMDRVDMFPALGNDGKNLMANSYYFIGISREARPTLELLAKGANGVNRSFVQAEYGGLTGSSRTPLSEGDYDAIGMLKENVFCLYSPECCGAIYKAS